MDANWGFGDLELKQRSWNCGYKSFVRSHPRSQPRPAFLSEAVFLEAALGFGRNRAFEQTTSQGREEVNLAEMLSVTEAQGALEFVAA